MIAFPMIASVLWSGTVGKKRNRLAMGTNDMRFTIDQLVIFAARAGNLPLLKERVSAGGSTNFTDPRHGSALAEAIRCRHLDVLDWLIARGCNVNVQCRDARGPLEMALRDPDPTIVYRLVCAGARLTRTAGPHYRRRLEDCLRRIASRGSEDGAHTASPLT